MAANLVTPTILAVKGVQTAFGLRWESIPAQTIKAAQSHLLRSMKQANVKYAVLNETDDRRFVGGLCLTSPTQRLGKVYSAAAWLAEARRRPTLVIAELGQDSFWIGVADPNVWLAGDAVGTRAESGESIDGALEHFDRIGQAPEIVVIPSRPDGTPMEQYPNTARLTEVLASQGLREPAFLPWESVFSEAPSRDVLIGQMTGVDARTSWLAIGVAGVAAVALLGHTVWNKYQEEERLRLEMEQAALELATSPGPSADEIEAERQRRKAQAIAAALQRHTDTVSPATLIARCRDALVGLGGPTKGWNLSELACDAAGVSGTWSAPPSLGVLTLTERVAQAIEASNPASMEIDASGRSIKAGWKFEAIATRGAWVINEMPQDNAIRRLLLTRGQFSAAGSRQAIAQWGIGAAAPADITYVDPALETDANNPARFVQVLPPEGFRVVPLAINGIGAWRITSLDLELRPVTVKKITFRPGPTSSGQDQIPWTLEAEYVVQ